MPAGDCAGAAGDEDQSRYVALEVFGLNREMPPLRPRFHTNLPETSPKGILHH
jgi:hypothetical protein